MSDHRPVPPGLPAAAAELDHALDTAIDYFAAMHEDLLRRACSVAPDVPASKMRSVVVVTLLGHTVALVRRMQGRAAVEGLITTLLDQLDQVEPLGAQERKERVQ